MNSQSTALHHPSSTIHQRVKQTILSAPRAPHPPSIIHHPSAPTPTHLAEPQCHWKPDEAGSNPPRSPLHAPRPLFRIRKHLGFWSLTFEGQEACFNHEQGAYYVAYLLLNPPTEPIHGLALALRANALYDQLDGETIFLDPGTAKAVPLPCDAMVFQRNLCLDDAEALASLRRKQLKLEAILDEENETEPTKAEVLRELEAIYEFQKTNAGTVLSTVQKVVRAVRRAIHRFHGNLARAVDPRGNPHLVLRPFAQHLGEHVIAADARLCRPGVDFGREEATGCFTYEPPAGVEWTG